MPVQLYAAGIARYPLSLPEMNSKINLNLA
eukprot:SAG31_NODE_41081_length_277_cov_2.567416_1_plen_29_part_10